MTRPQLNKDKDCQIVSFSSSRIDLGNDSATLLFRDNWRPLKLISDRQRLWFATLFGIYSHPP